MVQRRVQRRVFQGRASELSSIEMTSTELEQVRIPVSGMSCQACAQTVRKALLAVPGVAEAEVQFASRTATIRRDPEVATGPRLAAAVAQAGFGTLDSDEAPSLAAGIDFAERAGREELARTRRSFALALVFGLAALASRLLAAPGPWTVVFAAPVVFVAGLPILASGWRAARRRAPDMNTLVALGVLASFGAAFVHAIRPAWMPGGNHHALAAPMILVFVLFGRVLEAGARDRAGRTVRELLDLSPPTARVLRRGQEVDVPLAEVRPGRLVLIRPGERVPVDGEILEGRSALDESSLTGESAPVERGPGEAVSAGTLNGNGALSVKTTAVGAASALGRIAAYVQAAQSSRAPVQQLVDRVSAVFVPIVIAIALATLVGWLLADAGTAVALARAAGVLVVACPCALGLATPTAILAASGRGAREGVLIRDAGAFERLARVDTVVFDKTGTLTTGRPRVAHVELEEGEDRFELLALAAAVERSSEQPLAAAIVAAARELDVAIPHAQDVAAEPGLGISGTVGGRRVWLGSPRGARERGLDAARVERRTAAAVADGGSPVLLEVDGRLRATFGIVDTVRPESAGTVRRLAGLGITTHVFSGDHAAAVARVASELGVDATRARGELAPLDKAAAVDELRARGATVLAVGDGVNDAPLLSAANVGAALGGGSGVALEAADCALLRDDPAAAATLIALARRALRTIRLNLLWASAYNLLALPIAAGVLAPWTGWAPSPEMGAAAMAGSSLLVVTHSASILRARLTPR